MAAERLYTVAEVAEILKSNPNDVYKLMNTGLLKYLVIGRRKVRETTLNNFLAEFEGYDITDPENVKGVQHGEHKHNHNQP